MQYVMDSPKCNPHGIVQGMTSTPEGDWLTLGEAAEVLGVSRNTLYRRIEDGTLVGYQRGVDRRLIFKRSEVEALGVPQVVEPRVVEPRVAS